MRSGTDRDGGCGAAVRGILDEEAMSGTRAIERRLRAHRHTRLVDSYDYPGAVKLIGRLCQCWGGVSDLLVPVTAGGPVPEPYSTLLDHSEIDWVQLV